MNVLILLLPLIFTNSSNMYIEEKFQSDILALKNRMPQIVNHLYDISVTKKSSSKSELENLESLLSELKTNFKKISQTDLFYSALALGEYVRSVNKGKWILLEKLGSDRNSKYFTPAIIYSDNSIFLLFDFLETYFTIDAITPSTYANLPYIKEPGLKLGNSFYKHNIYSHKRID